MSSSLHTSSVPIMIGVAALIVGSHFLRIGIRRFLFPRHPNNPQAILPLLLGVFLIAFGRAVFMEGFRVVRDE